MHHTKKKPELNRQEWDFSACPTEEREICLHYECAREFARTRPDLIEKLAEDPRPYPYNSSIVFGTSKETNQDGIPVYDRCFPTSPWLSIPLERRLFLIRLCKPLPEEDPSDPDLLAPDDFDVTLFQQWDAERRRLAMEKHPDNTVKVCCIFEDDGMVEMIEMEAAEQPDICYGPKRYYPVDENTSYAVVKIDWGRSNHQLRKAYDRLLELRPTEPPKKENNRFFKVGRGFGKDRFNWLAAKRLHRHYGTCEEAMIALDAAYAGREKEAPYTNVKALGEAVRKFDGLLADLIKDGRFSAFDVFDRQRKN